MNRIPIGIVTRNRAVYLDCTLKSLSATRLPNDPKVIVFDDASNDPLTRTYLDTAETIESAQVWPKVATWSNAGLSFLPDNPVLHGIAKLVEVRRLGSQSLGT